MSRGKTWCMSELYAAVEMRRSGMTCSQISVEINRTPVAVKTMLTKLGFSAPPRKTTHSLLHDAQAAALRLIGVQWDLIPALLDMDIGRTTLRRRVAKFSDILCINYRRALR